MAEAILYNVAAKIIESLGSQALKEIGLLWGVTDELEKLKNTVSTIQTVLLHSDQEQWAVNPEVRDWLEKIKDVVYDVDDLLDGFSTDCLVQEMMTRDKMAKKVRIFFSKSNQLVYDFKMGHKIKVIRQKLDAITNDRTKFHLDERPVEIGRARQRDTHSFVLEEEVIGREHAKKEIIDKLLSDSNVRENVGILPITGIGGLGKTTLAQLIFNDEEIDKHFHELKMWVCVSDNFDVRKVVEKILESATKKKPKSVEMDTLVHDLRKEIGGKKYLLVLDDVWNEKVAKWDELKKLLMTGAIGSRILVTTRSAKVARITQSIEPYSLKGLDIQKSWCLFKQVAFENGQEPVNSRKIVEVGKKIVEKCSGVPLAIKTIGRLLSLEDSEAGWDSFEKNKMAKIKKSDILPTLKLSYDQLPSHLKQCFAYCSIFPKDYVMEKSKLISLWIAQGFIKPSNQNECLEDVGHEYFMDLLWRSFFQEAEMDDWGNVFEIKMHDLMHDLAMSEAGSLITRLESEEKIIGDQKTRHVSVVDKIDFSLEIPTSSSRASKIRTLLCVGGFWHEYSSTSCEAIFSSLKFLRVLDLHGRQLDIPSSICKLKHLRDLDLSRNSKIKKLPDSISRLQNLYSLRLSGCSSLKELPRGITKLVNLRHLYNDKCDRLTYMPRGLGQLKNLQTLSEFVVHSDLAPENRCRLSELNTLNSLRGKLEIRGLRHDGDDVALLDDKGANLKEKEHLQVLTLNWSRANVNARDENMALEGLEPHPNLKELRIDYYYGGVRVPMWLLSLTNLVHLTLDDCWELKYLPPLSRLPSLKSLRLRSLNEIEYVSDCSDNNELSSFSSSALIFPSLEVIYFGWCPNLKGWWRRSDSYNVDVNTTDHALLFPRLSELTISCCPTLTSFPMFPHLEEELHLRNASWKPVQQTITNASSSSASSTPIAFSSPPLSKLKHIWLQEIEDLEILPEDGLQNLISLQHLTIDDCPRLKSLSQGVQYLTALTNLCVSDCPVLDLGNDEHEMQWKGLKSLISLKFGGMPKLVSLPLGLQHVTTLRKLKISVCSSLMAIPEWICNWASLEKFTIYKCSGLTSLPEAMSRLTSLQELRISYCPVLDLGNDEHKMQWKGLESLIYLKFTGMPKLVSLPLGLQHVTTLRKFRISVCSSLPEWICNWASLEEFTIYKCSGLTSLPEAMRRLTSLQELRISYCPLLDLGNDEHGMQWKGLESLISLEFKGMPKLVSLPLGLQHVTTLRKFRISNCSSLVVIPEWICNWASLEEFTIYKCSGLTSLPEAMSRLTSLKTLEIHGCPILLRRCELGGEDRPKIAHIPKLDFRLRAYLADRETTSGEEETGESD